MGARLLLLEMPIASTQDGLEDGVRGMADLWKHMTMVRPGEYGGKSVEETVYISTVSVIVLAHE